MTATAWDVLHQQARHRLEYPSEHVVRFIAGVELDPEDRRTPSGLDIGCGSGRHSVLLDQFGFDTRGCDVSPEAVRATKMRLVQEHDEHTDEARSMMLRTSGSRRVLRAPMTELPYPTDHFDVALAYGVFYYGTLSDHAQAVTEMHRVLRPGGQGFVCVRTANDWRATGPAALKGEPEEGMTMHFLHEEDIGSLYGVFSGVAYELTETTTGGRTRTSSDWLISVTK